MWPSVVTTECVLPLVELMSSRKDFWRSFHSIWTTHMWWPLLKNMGGRTSGWLRPKRSEVVSRHWTMLRLLPPAMSGQCFVWLLVVLSSSSLLERPQVQGNGEQAAASGSTLQPLSDHLALAIWAARLFGEDSKLLPWTRSTTTYTMCSRPKGCSCGFFVSCAAKPAHSCGLLLNAVHS